MSNHVISAKKLTKQFNDKTALDEINFHVKKGEVFGFLGPSGSGKTTTIKILTGQEKLTSGVVKVLDKEVRNISKNEQSKMGIVSDENGFYEKLSLYDNLLIYAKLYQFEEVELNKLLDELKLSDSKNTLMEKISTGMKQRMFLIRSLIKRPNILFLDEPTSGLDPATAQIIHKILKRIKNRGVSIFLTTHDMHEATKLCDRLVILHKGKIIEEGTPDEIIEKHNKNKVVEIKYKDGTIIKKSLDKINKLTNVNDLVSIHSMEPNLEEIFINMTGEELHV